MVWVSSANGAWCVSVNLMARSRIEPGWLLAGVRGSDGAWARVLGEHLHRKQASAPLATNTW
jgi:hypothetical protein